MSKQILVNHPGGGERVMELCKGPVFRPDVDHSICSYRSGKFLGGFVLSGYLGNSIAVHDGADDVRWCSRDMMWMLFHYIFVQLRCHKAYAPVASDNYHALDLNLRAGWRLEYVLRDAVSPGVHAMILAMSPVHCRWLMVAPQQYLPGDVARRLATHG